MTRAIVIGRGWVGQRVAAALGSGVVETIDVDTEPWLAHRDAASSSALHALVSSLDATAIVNTAGRLTGTPEEVRDANAAFPTWLADALAGSGLRLVHVGSASEYGDPGGADPLTESSPLRAAGVYGESKLAGSEAVRASRRSGLDSVVARVFNPVGSGIRPDSPLGEWLTAVDELPDSGGTVTLFEADTIRDFVDLDDVGRSLAALATAAEVPEVVNVCSGVGVRYGDIAEAMIARAGKQATVESLGKGGIMCVIGDNTLLAATTGIRPTMDAVTLARLASL